jgi:hypothetical protein
MKKPFWVRLAIVMLCLMIPNAIAPQCSKSEIDDICYQESYCCCQIKTYK